MRRCLFNHHGRPHEDLGRRFHYSSQTTDHRSRGQEPVGFDVYHGADFGGSFGADFGGSFGAEIGGSFGAKVGERLRERNRLGMSR